MSSSALDISNIIIWSFGIRIIANLNIIISMSACKLPQVKTYPQAFYTELYSLWLGYE